MTAQAPTPSARLTPSTRLKKELRLFDVFAISAGALFSSGFFLLPGIAFAKTGPSVTLAYVVAGLLFVPAMLSKAELATAMPKAGGTYYFLDRALGPVVGTVGGLGIFLALTLKTAFALIGMGAYLGLVLHLGLDRVRAVAVAFTVVMAALNILGAKQTTGLLRVLVSVLLGVLGFLVASGLLAWARGGHHGEPAAYFTHGAGGFVATIGLVFVSFAGLTKVASVAEEVDRPARNIPLGMVLSLGTATLVYALGTAVIVALVPAGRLAGDLTPVATAAHHAIAWLPGGLAVWLVVVSAIAAFTSAANAGVLSSSRYLLAMGRDHLVSPRLAELGRFRTPTLAVVVSAAVIIAAVLALEVESVAKLASAFQLLIFGLVNLAVIVMRESRITSYDPDYRSPLYPWLQLLGIGASCVLIVEMGAMTIAFTVGLVAAGLLWYVGYASRHVVRGGAIYHLFERLGRRRFDGLEIELREILREKGLRDDDPYDEVVARAFTLDVERGTPYRDVALRAAELLAQRVKVPAARIAVGLIAGRPMGMTPVADGVALPHVRLEEALHPELCLVRCPDGLMVQCEGNGEDGGPLPEVGPYHAMVFLVSPERNPRLHLRLLAQIAEHVNAEGFMSAWLAATRPQEMRETVLRSDRFLSVHLREGTAAASFIGRRVMDLGIPDTCLVAAVRRDGDVVFPRGHTVLLAGDSVTFIGETDDISRMFERYHDALW